MPLSCVVKSKSSLISEPLPLSPHNAHTQLEYNPSDGGEAGGWARPLTSYQHHVWVPTNLTLPNQLTTHLSPCQQQPETRFSRRHNNRDTSTLPGSSSRSAMDTITNITIRLSSYWYPVWLTNDTLIQIVESGILKDYIKRDIIEPQQNKKGTSDPTPGGIVIIVRLAGKKNLDTWRRDEQQIIPSKDRQAVVTNDLADETTHSFFFGGGGSGSTDLLTIINAWEVYSVVKIDTKWDP